MGYPKTTCFETGVDESATNLVATLSNYRYTPSSKTVKICYSVSKRQWLKFETRCAIRPKTALFDPEKMEEGGEMSSENV